MKRFKSLLLFCCMLFLLQPLHAERVEPEKAQKLAQRYVQLKQKTRATADVRLKYTATNKKQQNTYAGTRTVQDEQTVAYYVFNINEKSSGGFVIVAGDDVVKPILGYSNNGSYDEKNLPPNFAYWMDYLQQQIAYAQERNLQQSETIKKEWDAYLNGKLSSPVASVEPLIQTYWNQGAPYNYKCPPNTYTGCVATAMAQIIKYHNYPTRGIGQSEAYNCSTSGIYIPAVDFEVNYDWANMLNIYDDTAIPQQEEAVATLMYHCGVSVEMDYGIDASSANSVRVLNGLITHFNYDYGMDYCEKGRYTDSQWADMLKTELSSSRPVYYSGSGPGGGHAFVCDGYDSENKFHFNWGWGGWYNGYFVLSALNPGEGHNYNDTQAVIIGIKPATGYSLYVDTTPISFNASGESRSLYIKSNVDWDASSDASWLTVSPVSGSNDGTLILTTTANTDSNQRTATVTISGTGLTEQKKISIMQYSGSFIGGEAGSLAWSISDDGTLTISSIGAMPGYSWSAPSPWSDNITQKEYMIVVVRASRPLSSEATLSSINLSTGTLSPAFDPDVFTYQVHLDELTDIEIFATPTHNAATVNGAGVKTLSIGENKFDIVVTAEDGVTKTTYTITITLEPTSILAEGNDVVVTFYPNPVKDILHVKVKEEVTSDVTIQIYNLLGEMKQSEKFNTTSFQVDLSGYPAGVLVVRIINGNSIVVRRLMKLE